MTPRGPAPAHASMAEVLRVHAPMAVAGAAAFVFFETIAALRDDASALAYAAIMILLFVVVATADRWVGFTTRCCGAWWRGRRCTWPAVCW